MPGGRYMKEGSIRKKEGRKVCEGRKEERKVCKGRKEGK
jgi:hypothetical protein